MITRLSLITAWVVLSTTALAQDAPATPVPDPTTTAVVLVAAPDSAAPLATLPPAAQAAGDAWVDALAHPPRLVTLRRDTSDGDDDLEARLKVLGEKTFSNREWKTYWQTQATRSDAVAAALSGLPERAELLTLAQRWSTLAGNKVNNQDAFFEAIERERDALERHLEATLERAVLTRDQTAESTDDPTPYEARRHRLDALDEDLAEQQGKLSQARAKATYIARLLESEEVLATALARDQTLAEEELAIATAMAADANPWAALWGDIAAKTSDKAAAIAQEYAYGQARHRSREVEQGLADSQIAFREGRVAQIADEIAEEGSTASLVAATWQTVTLWVRTRLWRIALGLFAVYLGVRFSLQGTRRAVKYILARADDNPDQDDDGDQRRATLADVFTSVARIAITVVGGLIALEQIGVNTAPLLGSVAILGLAISFGSQNLVRDVVNGFFILLENQFAVGDVVTISGVTGTVDRINIRSTWVRSASGDLHAIPNGGIDKVSNLTRGWSRAIANIGVGYDTDLDHVANVLTEVGERLYADPDWKDRLEEVPQFVGVTELGDSAVTVRLQVKVDAGAQWAVQRELFKRAKIGLDAAGIDIPFPQVVVHHPDMTPTDAA